MSHYNGAGQSEIFLGNTLEAMFPEDHLKGLKTVRLGDVAYDLDGKVLPDYYKPLFLDKSEAGEYDRIMMDRLKTN